MRILNNTPHLARQIPDTNTIVVCLVHAIVGAIFPRSVTDLLKPHQNKQILAYVDDLCLISKDFKAHLEVTEEVFSKYREARLRFNPEKANFGYKS